MMPAAMAIAVSLSPSSQGAAAATAGMLLTSPGTTHKVAAPTKTARTMRSPRLMGPRLRSCSSIISLPPGISARSERNSTRVMSSHAMARKTTTSGTPSCIHCRNPISSPSSLLTYPATIALGGLPSNVPRPPMDAAQAIDSTRPMPKTRTDLSSTTSAMVSPPATRPPTS